jgi:hypothetical protein
MANTNQKEITPEIMELLKQNGMSLVKEDDKNEDKETLKNESNEFPEEIENLEEVIVKEQPTPDDFISETFEKSYNEIKKPKVPSSFLDGIVFDLEKIDIREKSPLEAIEDFKFLFEKAKATLNVSCFQSGYTADISALSIGDINRVVNTEGDLYTQKKVMYQVLHKHIENTSVGKLGFTDWMKITSFHDIQSILYGIFCQTFPGENDFDIECQSCKKTTKFTVSNNSLALVKDEESYEKLLELLSCTDPRDLIDKSLVHQGERRLLPDSKIIVDIFTPSIFDHLEMLRKATGEPKVAEQYREELPMNLFIKKLYMPNVKEIRRTQKPHYYPVSDFASVLNILSNLSKDDGKLISKTIESRIKKYDVEFLIKNAKCQHCNDSLPNIPIDMEKALFTKILQDQGE